ncbi:hypothetical protein PAXRUDRAFT_9577 [Paxillus rubicundulus Ve08.2h10]|uniref:RING-type domain-containing protein n=1 Tax=Paxillus rubicundulus Ve08.2h10 TaxID=930991 RepID=A0A0D0E8C0_9AGAM|nr:hypothetical protein PAXRUDRAFT_9577 [Paxillus rubicundulus Ve08.2h10]
MDAGDDLLTIDQVESLRCKASYYWPSKLYHEYTRGHPCEFRPALNLNTLISLLSSNEELGGDIEDEGDEDPPEFASSCPDDNCHPSNKRHRSASPSSPLKRQKINNDPEQEQESHGKYTGEYREHGRREDYVEPEYKQIYPSYWNSFSDVVDEPDVARDASFFQVYQYAVNLRYNRSIDDNSEHYANNRSAEKWGWLREEKRLLSLIATRRKNMHLAQDIDMGRFYITRYHGRLLALSGKPGAPYDHRQKIIKEFSERWLLLLPDIPWPDNISAENLEQYDIQPSDMHREFTTACAIFQSHDRGKLEANLRLHILPEGTWDPTCELPFRLHAHFTLSLVMPTIGEPFDNSFTQRQINELEGLQRRLICFLSKTPLSRPVPTNATNEHEVRDATIPFFLSIMRPAPPLPVGVTYESLQPDGLISTLLPFQRRTVAWMLEREGKMITPEGSVVPIIDSTAPNSGSDFNAGSENIPVFWEKIVVGGRELFFNRLTGAVSSSLTEPHAALGGILAEEPGLGKTMECLALMLLNPAPERNPSNKRWDPEAQLDVKEIKTTLIVTPPALAAQWADELATHVPELKVFVYDGWAKVGVPITEVDVEVERERRRLVGSQKPPSNLKPNANDKRNRRGRGKSRIQTDEDDHKPTDRSLGPAPPDAGSDPNLILDWPAYINQYDVCITTYNVLRLDMTVARAPPNRPRRQDVEYKNLERPRSPLVVCEWYRVIMDEVQMMGMGKSEGMVSLIPRLSSFAVSGTPARAQVSDLIRVLRFLRVHDFVLSTRIWNRLLKHRFKDLFAAFFQKYSVRTLKSSLKNELTIPQQQRYLVGIELGRVERHVYDRALEDALVELGLDARGVAGYEGWTVEPSVLRNILRRLRGICTHPQVGQLQRQGDKLNKAGALKSIGDVLEAMRDQNWRNLMDDLKAKIQALIRLAQLQQHQSDDRDRYQRALEHLLTAETEVNELIGEIKTTIAQHHIKGEALKKEAQALRESRRMNVPSDSQAEKENGKGKGKGKDPEREFVPLTDLDHDADEEDDIEDQGLPKTHAGEEHSIKRRALQARLRECIMVLHRVKFLQGDVYHVLGSSFSEKEDGAYGDAENIRKDLLKTTEESANKAMRRLSVDVAGKGVNERALQIALPFLKGGGIKSTNLFDEVNEIIEDTLNEQSALLWQWRTTIIELLTRGLNFADEQADGKEYTRTIDNQGEAEVYLQAYTALLADRREAIAAERTLLAAHDAREKKARRTKAALAASAAAAARTQYEAQDDLEVPEDVNVQPQHEVLHKDLTEERKELYLQSSGRALKSIIADLASVAARIQKDTDPEKIIAKDGAANLRALIATQLGIMDKLDADLTQLRKAFNDRIVYFRHLQEISDTVAEVVWEGGLVNAMTATESERVELGDKIKTVRARQRYLDNLSKNKEGTMDDDDESCILCQCGFTRGFITQCAHLFCEGCMKAYIARRQSRTCPVCRAPIDPGQLQRFTIQGDQPPPPKPVFANGEPIPLSRREIQYNMIDPSLFADINAMESNGSYGTKIQTLVRHLLHIQLVDPGAKSIVFSAWADSLTIIEHALVHNNIPYLRLDQNRGKGRNGGAKQFRTNPILQVLLLHGERDNAGLNVTCASRVFLVESVVNHGFEVQAIARIDRMGQTRATEVFCYYAEDTVEKNILDLAARQNLSLYTKDNSAGSVNVTSFVTDSEKGSSKNASKKGQPVQKGDFIFKVNDMLAILFPHMFEDIEFLLPPGAGQQVSSNHGVAGLAPRRGHRHVNAEAGPSRVAAG